MRTLRAIGRWLRYDLPQGLAGVLYWLPFAWSWRPWDYQYGLDALERHLVRLEPCVRNGFAANREQTARDIRVAIQLLRRLREDSYWQDDERRWEVDWAGRSTPPGRSFTDRREQDWTYLFEHMRKHMQRWWD